MKKMTVPRAHAITVVSKRAEMPCNREMAYTSNAKSMGNYQSEEGPESEELQELELSLLEELQELEESLLEKLEAAERRESESSRPQELEELLEVTGESSSVFREELWSFQWFIVFAIIARLARSLSELSVEYDCMLCVADGA
jgi:hypothetical protein